MDRQEYSSSEIIENASAGLALCAYRVDGGRERVRSAKQILQCPKECPLQGPSDEMWHVKLEFSTEERSQQFCDAAKRLGWNAALSLFPPLAQIQLNGGASQSLSNSRSFGADTSCKVEVHYLPVKSFRIKRSYMQLSEEAMADLRAVQSRLQATAFLSQYHSHVSTGVYHLGAIRFAWFMSQSQARKALRTRKRGALLKADSVLSAPPVPSPLGAAASPFQASIGVGFHKEAQSADIDEAVKQEDASYYRVRSIGGTVSTMEDTKAFLMSAQATSSSWAIINSVHTGIADLVPIWDLALQTGEEHLKKPAELLRAAWQSSVAGLVHGDPDLFELHQASIVSTVLPTETSNMERISGALQALEGNPDRIYEELPRLWVSLPHEQRPELISIPAFIQIVYIVATRPDGMQPAREMLRGLLQSLPAKDHREILSKAGVTLEVQSKPHQIDEPQLLQLVQAHTITLEELPDKLLEIMAFTGTTPACASQSDSLTIPQQDAICNLLKKCMTDANNQFAIPDILALISQYGFESNGETCLCSPSRQVLTAMVEELRQLIIARSTNAPALIMAGVQDPDAMLHGSGDGIMSLKNTVQARAHDQNRDTKEQKGFKFTFIDDFLIHRPFPQRNKLKNLIHQINHGLGLFQNSKLDVLRDEDFWDTDDAGCDVHFDTRNVEDDQEGSHVIEETDVANSLIQIYGNSDTGAKIALLRLLLDQRWGVPLVYGPTSITGSFHTMEALDCVSTTIRAESSIFDLVQDQCLPRVVFLSSHHENSEHEHMAKQVTKFRFLPFCCKRKENTPCSLLGTGFLGRVRALYLGSERPISEAPDHECPLYIQLGMGFLQMKNSKGFPASQDFKPYIAIVVSGVYTDKECIGFLNEAADMIILQVKSHELGAGVGTLPDLTCKTVLRWAINTSGAFGEDRANKEIWGSAKHVAKGMRRKIQARLVKGGLLNMKQAEGRRNLRSISTTYFHSEALMDQQESSEGTISQTDFRKLREQMVLQNSFLVEATARFESQLLKHDKGHKQLKLRECNTQRQKRIEHVQQVAGIPIIQYFLRVLRHTDTAARTVCIIKLQKLMQEKSQKALEELHQKVLRAFETFEASGTEEAAVEYNYYKHTYAEKEVGMVHMWREVCHMFVAKPQDYSELPKLAARHLLDGFPLEILDGDAKFYSELWVTTVLHEAERLIRLNLGSTPRILVLSVLGTQSSGKSTVLNVMFGTQLPTKAGRCTRGVHIQLVKSGWPQYDYILLMDTEGIRCPENYGGEQLLSHDNRLATFAILPADACIMVVANEDDRSLKEVLPMVLLAFRGSAAAEKSGGRLRSKLLFVYRSVNINERSELWRNQQKLVEDLVEAQRQIRSPKSIRRWDEVKGGGVQTRVAIAQPSSSAESENKNAGARLACLFDFHVDANEDLSDIKFFGNVKTGSKPPKDVPDSRFGEKVLQLRDYLHKRVTESSEWKPFDLKEFSSYMNLVWRCIWDANFELSFGDAVQYHTFLELQESLQEPRLLVSRAYVEEKGALEKLSQDGEITAQASYLQSRRSDLGFEKVKSTIKEQTARVEKILESCRNLKWKAEEHQNWNHFLTQQDLWFNLQLNDFRKGVVLLEKLVSECNQRLLQKIIAVRDGSSEPVPFEDLFFQILSYAQDQHKPLARRVPMLVTEVYKRHKDINEYSFEGGEDPEDREQMLGKGLSMLIHKTVAPSLTVARQYSDDLVEEAINLTNTYIETHQILFKNSRPRIAYAHAEVRNFAIAELCKIQQSWDEQHNPAERLKVQKDHFQHFYKNHMSRYDMTDLFLKDLESVFVETLKSTLQDSLVNILCNSIEKAPWLSNWRVMRKLLDTLLLKLLHGWEAAAKKQDAKVEAARKVATLIDYVSDDSLFHQIVVEELIMKSIREMAQKLLEGFHAKIKHAVSYASACASTIAAARGRTGATKTFLDKLAEALKNDMPACRKTWVALQHISSAAYNAGEGRLEFEDIVLPGLHEIVNDICDEFQKLLQSTPRGLRDLADKVNKALQSHDNETFRSRCMMACPLCRATCFLPAFHKGSHDTLHQPQGFKGTIWQQNGQLSEKSCSEHYRDEDVFILKEDDQHEQIICTETRKDYRRMNSYRDFKTGKLECSQARRSYTSLGLCRSTATVPTASAGEAIPYEKFEEVFPEWRKPMMSHDATNPNTCKVRQCIFYQCQAELVKRHPNARPNDQIAHFAHDTAGLRFQLQQELPDDLRQFVAVTDLSNL